MSDELSAARFQDCLDQSFQVTAGEDTFEAHLVEVAGIRSDTERDDRSPFSVVFRGPEGQAVEQQIMKINNPTLGEHLVFLVPVGPDRDHESRGILYEAIFT